LLMAGFGREAHWFGRPPTEAALSLGGVVRAAFFAVDQQAVNLAFLGVQQDRAALFARVINRMVARHKDRRSLHDVTDAWCRDYFETDLACHVALPSYTGGSAVASLRHRRLGSRAAAGDE